MTDWRRRQLAAAVQIAARGAPPAPDLLGRFLGVIEAGRHRAGGDSPPLAVSWELIRACNLSCPHCFLDSGADPGRAPRLNSAGALALVEELAAMGVQHVTLTGGEPTLHPDLTVIVAALKAARIGLVLQTNGTRGDGEAWNRVAQWLDPRIDRVQVSLDGPDARSHDATRGPGSFAATLAGLGHMRAQGLAVVISTCPTIRNQDRLPELYSVARELGAVAFQATPLAPFTSEQDALTPNPALTFLAEAEIIQRASQPGAPAYLGGVSGELLHWVSLAEARPYAREPRSCPQTFSCGGLRDKLHITSDGSVYPCVFAVATPFCLGNVRERRLRDLWCERSGNPFARGRPSTASSCRGCDWGAFCQGGCPGLAMARAGRFDAADPRCGWARERAGQ